MELNKSKIYISPSKEQVSIFIDGKWTIFIRQDIAAAHATKVAETIKQSDYEFSLHRHWKEDERPWDEPTIKHFGDY